MNGKERVNLSKVIEKMNLVNLTPDIDVKGIWIHVPEFNRPALQLTGFYDQFDNDRIQIIGNVEYSYLKSLSETERYERYMQLLSSNIPCLIFCRNLEPEAEIIELAKKYQIPILKSEESTSSFSAEVIRWLKVQLAPCIVIHGVLVDVYGEGVLITGESGIGKSEAALELIKRGHRLVTDDAVEIRKVSNETLVGSAPGVTKYFIELRGIGIIDVKKAGPYLICKEHKTEYHFTIYDSIHQKTWRWGRNGRGPHEYLAPSYWGLHEKINNGVRIQLLEQALKKLQTIDITCTSDSIAAHVYLHSLFHII